MHHNPKTQKYLIYTAIFLMVLSIFASGFTFWYLLHNQESVNTRFQDSLREELTKYSIPEDKQPISFDDAKILVAVAKYCEAHDNCKGQDGRDAVGASGPIGPIGIMGVPGLSIIGAQGPIGLPGADGTNGLQGPQGDQGSPGVSVPTERKCVVIDPKTRRIEWRNQGDDSWQIEYYLPDSASCPEETQ